jgi:hypothetical protein
MTGFKMTSDVLNREFVRRGHRGGYRRDRVYATTDADFAEMFAAIYTSDDRRSGTGAVWEVELDDVVEPDPDFAFIGESRFLQAPRGRVVRLVTFVFFPTAKHQRTLDEFRELGADAHRTREIREAEERAEAKAVKAAKRASPRSS